MLKAAVGHKLRCISTEFRGGPEGIPVATSKNALSMCVQATSTQYLRHKQMSSPQAQATGAAFFCHKHFESVPIAQMRQDCSDSQGTCAMFPHAPQQQMFLSLMSTNARRDACVW